MIIKNSIAARCALLAASVVTIHSVNAEPNALPAKQFDHPDRIRYDGQCLTIDGQDTFIFSGAFHYFRVPKELWQDRFAKIKAAHFNAVETYVPWNYHEREMPAGLDDHSKVDLTDFRDWLKMAHEEFGLYTIIRPGPYICAEWLGGGFPQWLWSKQPDDYKPHTWVRTDEPTYLAWSKHWMDEVLPVIADEQITRKPKGAKGVILVQIENEYDFFGGITPAARTNHLKFLYEDAKKNGIDVPIFTCQTHQGRGSSDPELSQVFDASNFYSRWDLRAPAKGVQETRAQQPNAPAMVSELQGGWFGDAGGQLSEDLDGIGPAQINAITLTAVANGATILNYYMLVGGSNFGSWGGANILQSYDYYAPIREAGDTGEKYAAVQGVGVFLEKNGPTVARSQWVDSKVATPDVKIEVSVRKAVDGQLYVFCRNPEKSETAAKFEIELTGGHRISIDHTFPPRLITILNLPGGKTSDKDGTWSGEPAVTPSEQTPTMKPIRVDTAWTRDETGPTTWLPIAPNTPLIRAGVYDASDVIYRAQPKLTAEQAAKFAVLRIGSEEASRLALRVNGKIVLPRRAGRNPDFALEGILHEGDNSLELLYENHGTGNFGDSLNNLPGITRMTLVTRGASGVPLERWRVAIVKDAANPPEIATDFDDSSWDKVALDEKTFSELAAAKQPGHPPLTYPAAAILNGKNATAVYRTTIDLKEKELASKSARIEIGSIDDQGEIFINGKSVGTSNDYRKPFVKDVAAFVHAGRNVIAVKVTNTDADGGITKPSTFVSDNESLPLTYELGTTMEGVAGQWWNATDLSAWKKASLNIADALPYKGALAIKADAPSTLQRWVRTEFQVPATAGDATKALAAIIHASGDGFVYLNGHELGRYYDAGPQRRFYLPEPWLKLGAGETNVLTMNLHAVKGEPALLGMEVGPIVEQADQK